MYLNNQKWDKVNDNWYWQNLLFTFLEIPYNGGSFHMVLNTIDSTCSTCSQPLGLSSICILGRVQFVACTALNKPGIMLILIAKETHWQTYLNRQVYVFSEMLLEIDFLNKVTPTLVYTQIWSLLQYILVFELKVPINAKEEVVEPPTYMACYKWRC